MQVKASWIAALVGLLVLVGIPPLAGAHDSPSGGSTTWWVDASGAGLGTGTRADPFTNISYGVSRPFVQSGDSLVVAPGTYDDEEIDFFGKSLDLRSSGGPEVTTIVARPQTSPMKPHPAARMVSGELRVLIDGFCITGGTGSLQCSGFTEVVGGAIEACGGVALTVSHCVFENNRAEFGGAIYAQDSTLLVEDCLFTGPGTEARGEAIYLATSTGVVRDSTFMDLYLVAPSIPRGGGALIADQSTLLLERCLFERNATRFFGAHLWSRSGDVTVSRCSFGASTGLAGASISASGGTLRVLDSTVRLARAIQAPGAGIFGSNADILVEGSVFEGNLVDGSREGGAIAVQAGRLTVAGSRFLRNVAGQGGAVATSQSAHTLISNCRFEGNTASNGGGAFFAGDSVATIERSVFIDNSAVPTGSGGAVQGLAVLEHCSLAGNAAGIMGGAAADGAQLLRSIAWANAPTDLEPSVMADESMIGSSNGAALSLAVAGPPQFWSEGDLHLLPGSAGIDVLSAEQGFDADGSLGDVGAFVFEPGYCPEGCVTGAGLLGCVSEPNSSGAAAELDALGSLDVQTNRLVLLGTGLPSRVPTLMLASMVEGFQTVPSMRGPLCLGSPILRLIDLQAQSRLDGTAPTWVQLASEGGKPFGSGLFVHPGETWFFQLWFRDSLGNTTTNTSSSVQVTLR